MLNTILVKSGKRFAMLVSLMLLAVATFAVPAKPGLKRLLTLSDGSTVSATLVGDEHAHYWLGADGKAYQSAGDNVYQSVDLQAVRQHGAQRRAAANQRRTRRLAPRKVGEVGSITGDKKGIIILVNFKDVSFTASQADFNNLANTPNYNSGNYKGSMYDYFYAQSDGQFRLTFDVVGPVTVSQNREYYGANNSNDDDVKPAAMVVEAVKLVDNMVNFADYDWDGDGYVDQVYVVYAGKGEADGGSEDTIWPHEWELSSASSYGGSRQRLDGVYIDTYACGGEQNGSTGETAGIGTMCHEFSHCLGYPDFYDTDYSGGQGMGDWDLMCGGSYNGNGYQPAGYTSYERWVAGWKTPTELVSTQSISNMKALQDTGSDTYIIYNKGNRNEYYLLENRQKTGWDASLPGKGLLILHVDYNATAWSNNKPNDDPSHQRMTWIPADNQYQYQTSNGSKSYTTAGMKTDPFPYGSVNAFGKNTTPAATLFNNNSDGTKYLDSSLENITQNSNGTISFDFVGANDQVDPTPTPTGDALLYEGLSGYSGSDSSTELTTSNSYLDYNSWSSISKVYPGGSAFSNGGCLKFGSNNATGSMTSGSISLTGSGILTFYLKKYGSDTGVLNVTVTGATADVTEFTPSSTWTLCTVNLTNATGAVTITLATSSKRAYVDEITLSAVSTPVVATPELITDPESLTFEAEANASQVKTFDVLGADLTGNVTVSLTDANQVFSITPTTISKADAEEGATVSVTFTPTAAGTFNGTVTLSSAGAEPVTVSLSATATGSTTPVDPTPSGTNLLYESLSGYSGNDGTAEISNTYQYLDYKNWSSLSKIYAGNSSGAQGNGGCLKFGTSSAVGSMESGSISLTGSGTLTFYLKKYNTDSGKLNVTVTGATADVTEFTPATDWTLCTVNLTNATGAVTITLATSSKRAYVDEITLISGSGSGGGDTPDPVLAYYAPADGKQNSTLKTAMCRIIYNRTEKSYDYLWTAFQTTDVRSDGKIWDMYSNTTNYVPGGTAQGANYSAEGDSYNREHSWPQSWFSGNTPMYYDLHHVYPTDGFVNNKRGNYPFGETNNPTYSSENGFSKLGPCSYDGYTGVVFEPADEYKGDFARTYFYMVTCYEEKLADWYNGNADGIQATIDGSTYPAFQTWQLNMLMEWAKNDPVSEKEINRNNAVYAIQNNRNPFIDYPGLQEYIWGICRNERFDYDDYVEPVYSTPVTVPELTISNVTENGAEASWTACDGVTEYTIQLASDDQFTASTTTGGTPTTLISESFEGNSIPSGWTASSSNVAIASGKSGDGTYCVAFKGADAYLITPLVTNPSNVSFNYKRSSNNAGWGLEVSYATSTSGPWTYIGTTSAATTDWQTFSMELDNAGSVYIKFTDTRSSGNAERYIDLIQITGVTSGSTVPGSLIAEETVNGTSFTFTGLDLETTYFARVKGNAEWSNVEQFTTDPATASGEAPVLTASQGTSVEAVVGETVEFTVTATGIPTPAVSMAPTEHDAIFENGEFVFAPTAVGEYTFTFTAENTEGTDQLTVTVTVTPAPVTVPELAVSNITVTTAEATWTACDGVASYILQLASDNQFSNGGGSTTPILSEDFSGFSGTGTNDISASLDDNYTATDGWTGSKVFCNNGEAKIGSSSGQAWIMTPQLAVSGSITVVFSACRYGSSDQATLLLGISENGSDFLDETITINDQMTEYSETFSVTGSTAYIRWMGSGSSKARFYLDDVVISNTSSGSGSLIAEETVSGTSFTFTNLDPETTYYARVKGEAGWSNVEQFETEALETITLANSSDNANVIESNEGNQVNVTLADRTLWKDGDWNTLCLPFDMSAEQIAASALAGADIRALTSAEFNAGTLTLNFTPETGDDAVTAITAGTPYLIKWAGDGTENIVNPTFSGVTIETSVRNKTCELGDGKSITFSGTYSYRKFSDIDKSILFFGTNNTLYYPEDGATIAAQRAYFTLEGLSAGEPSNPNSLINSFVMNFEGETDGIKTMNDMDKAGSWYDLNGRKLSGKPAQKGIYIYFGKIVVVK